MENAMTLEELLENYERGRVWYDTVMCKFICAVCGKESSLSGTNYHDKSNSKNVVVVCRECDHKTRGVK
jgi:DNA-directed RNA polymerase subunit RPC12/RpoP